MKQNTIKCIYRKTHLMLVPEEQGHNNLSKFYGEFSARHLFSKAFCMFHIGLWYVIFTMGFSDESRFAIPKIFSHEYSGMEWGFFFHKVRIWKGC